MKMCIYYLILIPFCRKNYQTATHLPVYPRGIEDPSHVDTKLTTFAENNDFGTTCVGGYAEPGSGHEDRRWN